MATITVTNLNDSGAGSLRDALSLANNGDTITFAPNLAGGTLLLTSGQLDVTKNLTIEGDLDHNGTPDITIDAGGNSRVFDFGSSNTDTLDGLVMVNGSSGGGDGGAILGGQSLTVSNSRLTKNTASSAMIGEGHGGAIFVGATETLTLLNTAIYNNSAQGDGGAIYDVDGTVNIVNSTLSGNSAFVGRRRICSAGRHSHARQCHAGRQFSFSPWRRHL